MKLTFYYVRRRHYPLAMARTDSYYVQIDAMLRAGIIDEADFVMEVGGPTKRIDCGNGLSVITTSDVNNVAVEPGSVVWVRGMWKPWCQLMEKLSARGHWVLFYGAGTGRQAWPLWDVVLDDTTDGDWLDYRPGGRYFGRLWMHYRKAVAPIFEHKETQRDIDFCINANYIFDRKGQYIAYKALQEYKAITNTNPRVIIPGSVRRQKESVEMVQQIARRADAELIGHVDRSTLAGHLQNTKTFIHLGTATQGDRCPIEAGRCGCQVLLLGQTRKHSTISYQNAEMTTVAPDKHNHKGVAELMAKSISRDSDEIRRNVATWIASNDGLSDVGLGRMRLLFDFFRANPTRDSALLQEGPWQMRTK